MNIERRQQLESNLERILAALKAHYQPEQVIVFGSLASGQISETSDLDLLIVKETDKRFFERVRDVITFRREGANAVAIGSVGIVRPWRMRSIIATAHREFDIQR